MTSTSTDKHPPDRTPPGISGDPDLLPLEKLSQLLDNRFSVGGVRFGLDAMVGLIPGVGDVAGLGVTALILKTVWKKGAGVGILLQMLGNLVLDAALGVFPVLGDFFDVAHKANRKNVKLLQAYYADGTPKPPAGLAVAVLCVLFLALAVGMLLLSKWVVTLLWHAISGLFA